MNSKISAAKGNEPGQGAEERTQRAGGEERQAMLGGISAYTAGTAQQAPAGGGLERHRRRLRTGQCCAGPVL